jgi:hypothetical protein
MGLLIIVIAFNAMLVLYQLVVWPRRPLTWFCLALWLISGCGALIKINTAAH